MAGLAGFALVSYMARANISIAAELMIPALGLTKIQMGQVFTSFLIGYAIFQIPGGALGDKFGPRITLGISALVWALATLLTGLVPLLFPARLTATFAVLWIVRLLLGLSEATTFPVGNRVVRNWMPPPQRALGNSIMFLGTSLASALTGPLVSWVMVAYGWQASFYVTAIPALLIAMLWMWLARDHPSGTYQRPAHNLQQRLVNTVSGQSLASLPLQRNVVLLIVSYVSEGYVLFIFVFWMYIYLVERRGFSILSGGWIAAIPWITALVLTPLGGIACDRIARRAGRLYGAKVVIMVSYGLCGGLLFIAAYSGTRWISVASLSFSIAFLMSAESSFWSSATHLAGDHVGLLSGVMNTAGILGGIASTSLVPILVQRFGWLAALGSGTAMALFCVLVWACVREPASNRISPLQSSN